MPSGQTPISSSMFCSQPMARRARRCACPGARSRSGPRPRPTFGGADDAIGEPGGQVVPLAPALVGTWLAMIPGRTTAEAYGREVAEGQSVELLSIAVRQRPWGL